MKRARGHASVLSFVACVKCIVTWAPTGAGAVTVRTVASLSDIGDSCVTVSCVSTPMTVARRAGARWGESSRPSAGRSRLVQSTSRLVCGRVQRESNSPLRGLRVPGRGGRVRTSPLKHLPRTTVAPVAPARPVAVPPTRSAPTPPVASAAVRIATNSRDRAGVGLSFELARRSGHADAPAVAACGACSVGPRGARAGRPPPACQVRATPRGPRGTRARAALRVRTTDDRRYWLCGMRLCGYDYEAAMATWIEATTRPPGRRGGRVRQRVAPARCDSEVRRSVTARCSSLGAPSLHADRALQHYARGTRLYFTDIPSRLYY